MVSDVSKLGVGLAETIRDRVRDPEPAGNPKAVAATEESMEARKFRAEVRELRWGVEPIHKVLTEHGSRILDRSQHLRRDQSPQSVME